MDLSNFEKAFPALPPGTGPLRELGILNFETPAFQPCLFFELPKEIVDHLSRYSYNPRQQLRHPLASLLESCKLGYKWLSPLVHWENPFSIVINLVGCYHYTEYAFLPTAGNTHVIRPVFSLAIKLSSDGNFTGMYLNVGRKPVDVSGTWTIRRYGQR